jgi:hypothetical protein
LRWPSSDRSESQGAGHQRGQDLPVDHRGLQLGVLGLGSRNPGISVQTGNFALSNAKNEIRKRQSELRVLQINWLTEPEMEPIIFPPIKAFALLRDRPVKSPRFFNAIAQSILFAIIPKLVSL